MNLLQLCLARVGGTGLDGSGLSPDVSAYCRVWQQEDENTIPASPSSRALKRGEATFAVCALFCEAFLVLGGASSAHHYWSRKTSIKPFTIPDLPLAPIPTFFLLTILIVLQRPLSLTSSSFSIALPPRLLRRLL